MKTTRKSLNLIIDIGNTRAKMVVFDGQRIVDQIYGESQTLCAIDEVTSQYAITKAILSSVGQIGSEAEAKLKSLPYPILRLSNTTPLPVDLQWRPYGTTSCIDMPTSMGADRIAAIVGAMCMMPHTPLLIIDAGTCVTYEVIDDEGYYAGGNIAPGLQMRLASMHEHTALLPKVESQGEVPLLGHSTDTCMRSGAVLGLQYEIEGYINFWKGRFPALHVFLTGGDTKDFPTEGKDYIRIEPQLVTKGLNYILIGN